MTKHTAECRRVFSRLDPGCPRCVELANGAPRRQWAGARRAEQEAQSLRWLREHNCQAENCGPVCTYGDY